MYRFLEKDLSHFFKNADQTYNWRVFQAFHPPNFEQSLKQRGLDKIVRMY